MFYLCYLCLSAYSGAQHILCCVFLLIVYHMLPVSLGCPFILPLRYSLTFTIYEYGHGNPPKLYFMLC